MVQIEFREIADHHMVLHALYGIAANFGLVKLVWCYWSRFTSIYGIVYFQIVGSYYRIVWSLLTRLLPRRLH